MIPLWIQSQVLYFKTKRLKSQLHLYRIHGNNYKQLNCYDKEGFYFTHPSIFSLKNFPKIFMRQWFWKCTMSIICCVPGFQGLTYIYSGVTFDYQSILWETWCPLTVSLLHLGLFPGKPFCSQPLYNILSQNENILKKKHQVG